MTGDPDVVRYLYWELHDEDETRAALQKRLTQGELTEEGQWLGLAIELPPAGRGIGPGGLKRTTGGGRPGGAAFVLHPAFHGQGHAAGASGPVLPPGFHGLALP